MHFYDSLAVNDFMIFKTVNAIADIWSGAGFRDSLKYFFLTYVVW